MMTFGKYFIGQNLSEIVNELGEISKAEYGILKPVFYDEKIYHAKDVNFCERLWKVVIGVTQGKVYKISLQTHTTVETFDISEKGLWNKVYQRLNEEFEIHNDQEKIGNSFLTTWDTKFENIILNNTTLPNESVFSLRNENVLDITVTGNFAFTRVKRGQQIAFIIFIISGFIISQFVSATIAFIVFIVLGLTIGRKINQFLGKLFLKGIIKKGYVFFLCLVWGSIVAFGIRELFLIYDANIFLRIICYGGGIYISYIFYLNNKTNTMGDMIYGTNFKTTVDVFTIIVNIVASIAFNLLLR
ncbi:MAG TPA: hypothetical protein VIL78_05695 [Hanamia sp.]